MTVGLGDFQPSQSLARKQLSVPWVGVALSAWLAKPSDPTARQAPSMDRRFNIGQPRLRQSLRPTDWIAAVVCRVPTPTVRRLNRLRPRRNVARPIQGGTDDDQFRQTRSAPLERRGRRGAGSLVRIARPRGLLRYSRMHRQRRLLRALQLP